MNIQPLGDRILVKVLEEAETTKSGIVIPGTAEKEKKSEGEIVAIGEGEKVKKLNLKVGDKVMFGKYSGEEVQIEKVEHKFLKEEEILAVIK
ncbi:MAG: co-chaperone GroES [Candidatus Doudnabacteria bacterium]|nr:co-chaperone GroES [Candidatus Doudnabacteria bacterium]